MPRIQIISDFNIQVLGSYMSNAADLSDFQIDATLYGQVYQYLMTSMQESAKEDTVIVWTQAEAVLESYRDALRFHQVDHELVLHEIANYATVLRNKLSHCKFLIHPCWTLPVGYRGFGMLDYRKGVGLASLLARMNLRLCELLDDVTNFYLLDAEKWVRHAGPRASIPKMWYAAKVPFSNKVFQEAANDICATLNGLLGKSHKLIIVDLDNTLWGGVVGETGWQGIRLGGHDHIGEAYVDFQIHLKALLERGIQLAIVSKNDESVALEALEKHPEMQLRRGDFAGWRINWSDKAQNIIDLAEELKLGLDSVVFIDDNPAERGRVREALGNQVLVPDWPSDPAEYSLHLMALRCFDTPTISTEDRLRSRMYASERERRTARKQIASLDNWLSNLEIKVKIEALTENNLPRATQLLNKTNQMNLRTRRLSEQELRIWLQHDMRRMWTFRISDRFGDSGLTGIISAEVIADTVHITDFIMSCRVMGRNVETAMVHVAVKYAHAHKEVKQVVAEFLSTERNRPCLDFWNNSGFEKRETDRFYWYTSHPYPKPDYIDVEYLPSQ